MITEEIAGYLLNETERYCTDCVHVWAVAQLEREGYTPDKPLTEWTTEGLLNVLAALCDVDRDYVDSDNFPVPFSRAQAESDRYRAWHEGSSSPACAGRACGNDFLGEF